MMGFASALGKAKSLTEVVELQSRFAAERFNRFAKLAGEVVPPPKLFFFAHERESFSRIREKGLRCAYSVAAISARSVGVASGMIPNQSRKAGRA